MHLTIDRQNLLNALGPASRIAEKRTTIPIVSNVLLEASAAGLRVRATDLEIDAAFAAPARVATAGETTVSAALLHDIARKTPDKAELSLQIDKDRLIVRAGKARFTLQTLPAQDFPAFEQPTDAVTQTIAAKDLARLMSAPLFAVSTEETRYYLNGAFLHAMEDESKVRRWRAVSTDGHRLCRLDGPALGKAFDGVIAPTKTMQTFARWLETVDGDVNLSISPRRIALTTEAATIASKVIDGAFPDYQRVIPADGRTRAEFDAGVLRAAVERVASIASERGRAVKMCFADDVCRLVVNNPDQGEACDEVDCNLEGPPIEIGFNAKYLVEAMNAVGGDSAIFHCSDPGSPATLRARAGADMLVVLMPMRV